MTPELYTWYETKDGYKVCFSVESQGTYTGVKVGYEDGFTPCYYREAGVAGVSPFSALTGSCEAPKGMVRTVEVCVTAVVSKYCWNVDHLKWLLENNLAGHTDLEKISVEVVKGL